MFNLKLSPLQRCKDKKNVLEIGCGDGELLRKLKKKINVIAMV